MPLSEEQIVRYSRQILLKDVGGVGQKKLLAAGVRLRGEGSALSVAAAYVAASGIGVQAEGKLEGFLQSAEELGDLNPDAIGERQNPGILAAAGVPRAIPSVKQAPVVLIGASGTDGVILWRTENGCAGCFDRTAASLTAPPHDGQSVTLGALAALCVQRAALNVAPLLGAHALTSDGTLRPFELLRCEDHAA